MNNRKRKDRKKVILLRFLNIHTSAEKTKTDSEREIYKVILLFSYIYIYIYM